MAGALTKEAAGGASDHVEGETAELLFEDYPSQKPQFTASVFGQESCQRQVVVGPEVYRFGRIQ